MWLINTDTLELEEVWTEHSAKYAILSHRWEIEEVTFSDMRDSEVAKAKAGYKKIRAVYRKAKKEELGYVWVDTCCINKESSAELSEAINSMYRWYKQASLCFVYLSDVDSVTSSPAEFGTLVAVSQWFDRGWTLQELLAPREIAFYDCNWRCVGTKESLHETLVRRTGIDSGTLIGKPLSRCSVAQRMSWACRRKTSRIEDQAYCLLGIFEINMPLLYGEGEKAFMRLQEELIKQSEDHSIFAWSLCPGDNPGLLARNAEAFADCSDFLDTKPRWARSPYSMTNRGLCVKLLMCPYARDTYLALLNCVSRSRSSTRDKTFLGIFLRKLSEEDQYARVEHEGDQVAFISHSDTISSKSQLCRILSIPWEKFAEREVFVRQNLKEWDKFAFTPRIHGFQFLPADETQHFKFYSDVPLHARWHVNQNVLSFESGCLGLGCAGMVEFTDPILKIKMLWLGFDLEFNPWCFLATEDGFKTIRKCAETGSSMPTTLGGPYKLGRTTLSVTKHSCRPPDLMHSNKKPDELQLEAWPGIWALKGDRVNGLQKVVLIKPGRVPKQLGVLPEVSMEQVIHQAKLVWTIRISRW